jgi:hypothetical protein
MQPTTDEILSNLVRLEELLGAIPEAPDVAYLEIARSVSFAEPMLVA